MPSYNTLAGSDTTHTTLGDDSLFPDACTTPGMESSTPSTLPILPNTQSLRSLECKYFSINLLPHFPLKTRQLAIEQGPTNTDERRRYHTETTIVAHSITSSSFLPLAAQLHNALGVVVVTLTEAIQKSFASVSLLRTV